MRINFSLTPLELVQPWGTPDGRQSLHWFGLTDGRYWIDVGDGALFEYTAEVQERFGVFRYTEYQVARLHEDLLAIIPSTLEPVPKNLVSYLSGTSGKAWENSYRRWFESMDAFPDKDEFWQLAEAAHDWINRRFLDSGYLNPSANITFWSDETSVYVGWNNSGRLIEGFQAWQAVDGVHFVSRPVFENGLHSFHDRLMAEMQLRIEQVRAGALPANIQIDIDSLDREQQRRRKTLRDALASDRPQTEWEHVADAMRRIEAIS